MNLNPNALLDHIEISFYSILTSCLSGANRIRGSVNRLLKTSHYPLNNEEVGTFLINSDIPEKSRISSWTNISQALIPLVVWMILGFAAGFLTGMLKPW